MASPLARGTDGTSPPSVGALRTSTGPRIGLRVLALAYVGILVLVPLIFVFWRTFESGLGDFFHALSGADTLHAFRLSLEIALWAVVIDTVFGITVAILLSRHRFWGRSLLSAFVDLPVSISPIVVGLALILVYGGTGWFGTQLQNAGLMIINNVPGMVMATVFVSLPLVVRSIVPVLDQAGTDQEQAAKSLGANAVARFRRITFPTIRAAVAYGVVLSFARCLGEYGAVLVVSGNIAGQTETAPLLIGNVLNYEPGAAGRAHAYAVAFVLVVVAILAILAISLLRRRQAVK
jgi:sulfate transport system permease protein